MVIRNLTILFFILFISMYPGKNFAAIPIRKHRQKSSGQLCQKVNEASATYVSRSLQQDEVMPAHEQLDEQPDSGINGSLAFAFGLLGIFPVAIILGIIGMQPHRKDRGLAIAGVVLGFLGMLYFIAILILFFTMF